MSFKAGIDYEPSGAVPALYYLDSLFPFQSFYTLTSRKAMPLAWWDKKTDLLFRRYYRYYGSFVAYQVYELTSNLAIHSHGLLWTSKYDDSNSVVLPCRDRVYKWLKGLMSDVEYEIFCRSMAMPCKSRMGCLLYTSPSPRD